MADIFQDGDEGSRGKFVAALEALQSTGQSVLDDLAQTRTDTLLRFEQGLGALNSRRQRAFRLPSSDIAARFIVSDLLDVDQTTTSATLRAGSQAVTLRERNRPASPAIQSQKFSTSAGMTEQFNGMYRVTTDGSTPVGTFDLVFNLPLELTLVVFDIVMTPSNPNITVLVSANGVTFNEALGTSMSGYQVTAWLPAGEVKYLRIKITPNHPDTLGGSSYTFGLTSFNAFMVAFQLASEMTTLPVPMVPLSNAVTFAAEDTPGVLYFLSMGAAPFVGVTPGQSIPIPGAAAVLDNQAALDGTGQLSWKDSTGNPTGQVPSDVYLPTLVITMDGVQMRVAPGLDPTKASRVTTPVFCWFNGGLYYKPFDHAAPPAGPFTISYVTGPLALTARLRVQLTSRDRSQTPVFKGAQLENQ